MLRLRGFTRQGSTPEWAAAPGNGPIAIVARMRLQGITDHG